MTLNAQQMQILEIIRRETSTPAEARRSLLIGFDGTDYRIIRVSSNGALEIASGSLPDGYKAYQDTSFTSGESPRTLSINTDLGRNGRDGFILNYGNGGLGIEFNEAAAFGDSFTLPRRKKLKFSGFDVVQIRLTHSGTDTSYLILVK